MRRIKSINFAITDYCNRSCVDCCCNVPVISKRWSAGLEYIAECGKKIGRIERICFTGGEPTIHPMFDEITRNMRSFFSADTFDIETNGYGFFKRPQLYERFDRIFLTHYDESFETPNTVMVKSFEQKVDTTKTELVIHKIRHTARSGRGSGQPCQRGTGESVSVYKGNVYPCCMGWGIDEAGFVGLDYNWREKIERVALPCATCFFSR